MDQELYNWLQNAFYRDNHSKYKHHFDEWIKNITYEQIAGFAKQMYNDKNNVLGVRTMR